MFQPIRFLSTLLLVGFLSYPYYCQAEDGNWAIQKGRVWDSTSDRFKHRVVKVWDSFPSLKLEFVWDGEISDRGEASGQGKLVWKKQGDYGITMSTYVGTLENGMKSGRGEITYKSGAKYKGDWRDNKKNGKGEYYYKSGDHYQGEFKNGKMHGDGIYTDAFGVKYIGKFRNGSKKKVRKIPSKNTNSQYEISITENKKKNHEYQLRNVEYSTIPYIVKNNNNNIFIEPDTPVWKKWRTGNTAGSWGGWHDHALPISFTTILVKNSSETAIYVNSGEIVVRKSKPDLTPYLDIWSDVGCGPDPIVHIINYGGKPHNCSASYQIKPENGKVFKFTRQVINVDKGIDLTKDYESLGVDYATLKELAHGKHSSLLGSNEGKKKIRESMGEVFPDNLSDNLQITTEVEGILKCDWNDGNENNTNSFQFKAISKLFDPYVECGALGPESTSFSIKFDVDKNNYTIPFSIDTKIKSREIYRLSLDMGAKFNSIHDFTIKLNLTDGSEIISVPVSFHYFNGSAINNPNEYIEGMQKRPDF